MKSATPPPRAAATRRPWRVACAAALVASLASGPLAAAGEDGDAETKPFRYRELSRTDIETELFGRAVEGYYASGMTFTESFNTDLTSDYSDAKGATSGQMSFKHDTFCFAYPDVPQMSGGCFVVWQRSQNCFDFYAALDGQAYAGFLARSLGAEWDARVWRQDAQSTCPTTPIS